MRRAERARQRERTVTQPPVHLREDRPKGSKSGKYFQRGRFLSIDEIAEELEIKEVTMNPQNQTKSLKMLRNIRDRRHDPIMKSMKLSLPLIDVFTLQHVTGKSSFRGILQEQRFKGKPKDISNNDKPMLECFSWWSVVVPRTEVISLKQIAARELIRNNPQVSNEPERIIMYQFANSPVFDDGSRYGNFKFSFPVEDLQESYREQHCTPGGTLVFRVLGTWTYQQEILHAVLIHGSQYNDKFRDLPKITGESTKAIFRVQNGIFICNLECSSNQFTICIRPEGIEYLECRRGVPCVWDNPSFAFYLPEGTSLEMAVSKENVEACQLRKPYMVSRDDMCRVNEAAQLINAYFTE